MYGNQKICGVKAATWIFLVNFCIFLSPVECLYIHLRSNDRKCYMTEIPDDTMVTGKFNVELETWDDSTTTPPPTYGPEQLLIPEGLNVVVEDPRGSLVLSRTYSLQKGRATFTSHTDGDHKICFNLIWPRVVPVDMPRKYRLHLDIQIGGQAVDYDVVSRKEKLTKIQLRIRKLLDLTNQIRKDQTYQVLREKRFRSTSESTNERVLWFAFIQTCMLLTMGYYHVHNLKNFFITKKLV